MKRLRVILLFLLLGAIVNVAVAWVGYTFSENSKGLFERWVPADNVADSLWLRHATDGWPYTPNSLPMRDMTYRRWYALLASGRDFSIIVNGGGFFRPDMTNDELREQTRGVGSFRVTQINSGFPLRSMRIEEWSGYPDPQFFIPTEGHDAFYLSGLIIPKHPIWPGFIVNTFFYAYLIWILIPLTYTLRCMIRNKKGLCPHCAYDLRGTDHAACPECGITIVPANTS